MSFGTPLALLSLLVVPAILVWWRAATRRPSRNAVVFTNFDVLASVTTRPRMQRRWIPVALLLLALACAAVATAQPKAHFTTVKKNQTVVLLVDVSGSMSAKDVEPTRLDAATAAMRTFLDRLPKSVNVGLVQFSSETEVLERPTSDREIVRESLGYLVPIDGTAIGDALATTVSLFHGPGAIVLLSDGTQTHGRLSPMAGAARARAAGLHIDTIALGTPDGALVEGGHRLPVPPDPMLMRRISHATGGRTFAARDAQALQGIYAGLGATVARKTTTREIASWFALGAALALIGGVGLARLWGAAIP